MKRFKIDNSRKRNRKEVDQNKPVEVLHQSFHKFDIIWVSIEAPLPFNFNIS